jgi:hypothetical protein
VLALPWQVSAELMGLRVSSEIDAEIVAGGLLARRNRWRRGDGTVA